MYNILIIDGDDTYFYSQGDEIKEYDTIEEAAEEIKELQKMEEKLFNNVKIGYKVVKVDE